MQFFRNVRDGHQRLKERIHATRVPLGPAGQRVATLVYMSIPLVLGKICFDYTTQVSDAKWKVITPGNFEVPENLSAKAAVPSEGSARLAREQLAQTIDKLRKER